MQNFYGQYKVHPSEFSLYQILVKYILRFQKLRIMDEITELDCFVNEAGIP